MRKVIKGRLYDTDKATMVAEHTENYPNDFSYVCETLYRKRTGEYFLHGRGNANTRYATPVGGMNWSGGEAIRPLSYEDAREWMERNADVEGYEREFGEPDEGDSHDLHVLVSSEAWQAISRAARTEGVTVSTIIERMAATL